MEYRLYMYRSFEGTLKQGEKEIAQPANRVITTCGRQTLLIMCLVHAVVQTAKRFERKFVRLLTIFIPFSSLTNLLHRQCSY